MAEEKSLSGKLETVVEIQAEAHLFYDVFTNRPHHVPDMSSDKVKRIDMHEGEWGKEGTVFFAEYFHDGEHKVAKQLMEKTDDENLSVTFKVIDGDLLKEYKSFKFILQVTPKGQGGSLVHWTLEYEKLKEDTPDPHSLLEFCVHCSKEIEPHIIKSS